MKKTRDIKEVRNGSRTNEKVGSSTTQSVFTIGLM